MWCCRKRNYPRGGLQGACFCRGRVSRSRGQKRLGADRLALAGNHSARGGFCVRPGGGGEEAWSGFASCGSSFGTSFVGLSSCCWGERTHVPASSWSLWRAPQSWPPPNLRSPGIKGGNGVPEWTWTSPAVPVTTAAVAGAGVGGGTRTEENGEPWRMEMRSLVPGGLRPPQGSCVKPLAAAPPRGVWPERKAARVWRSGRHSLEGILRRLHFSSATSSSSIPSLFWAFEITEVSP